MELHCQLFKTVFGIIGYCHWCILPRATIGEIGVDGWSFHIKGGVPTVPDGKITFYGLCKPDTTAPLCLEEGPSSATSGCNLHALSLWHIKCPAENWGWKYDFKLCTVLARWSSTNTEWSYALFQISLTPSWRELSNLCESLHPFQLFILSNRDAHTFLTDDNPQRPDRTRPARKQRYQVPFMQQSIVGEWNHFLCVTEKMCKQAWQHLF